MTTKSPIEEALRTSKEGEELHITNEERLTLIEILAFVASLLVKEKIWINGKGSHNLKFAQFCEKMAKKFSNMEVITEQ